MNLGQEIYCKDLFGTIGFGVAGSRKCFFVHPPSDAERRLRGVTFEVAKQFCESRRTVLAEINNFLEQFAVSTKFVVDDKHSFYYLLLFISK